MTESLRVVVGEDFPLLRHGVEQVLTAAGMHVVAASGDAETLLGVLTDATSRVDVAVVDIKMPPEFSDEGLRVLETLRAQGSSVGVLLLSMYLEPGYATRALAAGHEGVGYLLKDRVADIETFVDAVTRVAAGGSAIDADVVSVLAHRPAAEDELGKLTGRERQVLQLMAQGRSNRWIAEHLAVNDKTVETHVSHIFQKLALPPTDQNHRRVAAVLRWLDRR